MIDYVTKEKICDIVTFKDKTKGKFITVEGNHFIAVDNTTGDAFTEEFIELETAIEWLNNPNMEYHTEIELAKYNRYLILKKVDIEKNIKLLEASGINSKQKVVNNLKAMVQTS